MNLSYPAQWGLYLGGQYRLVWAGWWMIGWLRGSLRQTFQISFQPEL